METKLIDGQTFGLLTVIELAPKDTWKSDHAEWICQCACGRQTQARGTSLRFGTTAACPHCPLVPRKPYKPRPGSPNALDLTGQIFGKLTAIEKLPREEWKGSNVRWLCLCECGNTVGKLAYQLRDGTATDCGCQRVVYRRDYPGAYGSWRAMKRRCTHPSHRQFKYYGGRGIIICERWRTNFANFLEDMGERPEGMTLDRINSDGNYEPSNVRWATSSEQAANRRPPGGLFPRA